MKKSLFSYTLLTTILTLGSLFAWYTNITKIISFYGFYGTMNKFQYTIFPNPLITPCFWGGVAFLLALWLSIKKHVLLKPLLIGGALFAWGNWSWGLAKFYILKTSDTVSCSGTSTDNPFLTPCFIGASFFTAALINVLLLKRSRK